MLRCTIVRLNNYLCIGTIIVSFTASLFQSASLVPVLPLVQGIVGVSALAGFLVFFKPLLTGIARALVLLVRPRLS
jgi:hypothetical protein